MYTIRSFEARTISWWFDQISKLDFEPSYQRKGRLWSEKDRAYLIDSILNGFDMPKIYIADFTFYNSKLNEKRKPYAIIDGKQRLDAMFSFYRDEFTLSEDFIYFDDISLKLAGLSFRDLKSNYPEIANKFENFNLSVISIITDDDSMINEQFIRLNKSKPLTGAELRNAMKGEVPKLSRKIIQHKFFKENIKFDTKRGQDLNIATKLLLLEFRGKFVDLKKRNLDKLVEESAIAAETTNFDSTMQIIMSTLDKMNSSFIDKDKLLSSSGIIPIYYWFYRSNYEKYPNQLRIFLVEFDDLRKQARHSSTPDTQLLIFEKLAKSLNDSSSLVGCYNILTDYFTKYLQKQSLDIATLLLLNRK